MPIQVNINAPEKVDNQNQKCVSMKRCLSTMYEDDSCYSPTSIDAMEYEIVADEGDGWPLNSQNIIENDILNSARQNGNSNDAIKQIPSVIECSSCGGGIDESTFIEGVHEVPAIVFYGTINS